MKLPIIQSLWIGKPLSNVGGYNKHFKMAEDYELWLRMVKQYPIRNIAEPLCYILVHSKSMTGGGAGPARLVRWHMLAKSLALGLVTDADVERIAAAGIDTFADEIPGELQAEYLALLAAGLKNAGQYKQSLAVFKCLAKDQGYTWKNVRNILKLTVKSWRK